MVGRVKEAQRLEGGIVAANRVQSNRQSVGISTTTNVSTVRCFANTVSDADNSVSVHERDSELTYQQIVTRLHLEQEFLDQHLEAIVSRLERVASELQAAKRVGSNGDKSRQYEAYINRCLHLASNVALLGSNDCIRRGLLDELRQNWTGRSDPATVIAASTLRYLLTDYLTRLEAEKLPADGVFNSRNATSDFQVASKVTSAIAIRTRSLRKAIKALVNHLCQHNWSLDSADASALALNG